MLRLKIIGLFRGRAVVKVQLIKYSLAPCDIIVLALHASISGSTLDQELWDQSHVANNTNRKVLQ